MQMFSSLKTEVIEQIISPIVVINRDYSIIFFNRAFANITGFNFKRIKLGEKLNNFLVIENLIDVIENCKATKSSSQNEEKNAVGKNDKDVKIILKVIPYILENEIQFFTLSMIDISVETKLHLDFKTLASEKKNRRETEQRFLISNTLLTIRIPSEVLNKGVELLSQFYPDTTYLMLTLNENINKYLVTSQFPPMYNVKLEKQNISISSYMARNSTDLKTQIKTLLNEDYLVIKPITKSTPPKALIAITGISNENNPEYSALDEFISLITSAYEKACLYKQQKEYEAKLTQAKKMESIGILAGGVAHDLNNILSGIVGYPDMLLFDTPKEDPNYEIFLTMKNAGEKAASIVQDLLILTRRGAINLKSININKIIEETLSGSEGKRIFKNNLNVTINKDLNPDIPNILGSENHISRSFTNLLMNSIESLGEHNGTISIKTSLVFLEKPLENYADIIIGEYICLEVADTGEGISEENIKRIFEPFFTTKKMSKNSGTGLGLSILWGTLEDHNGYVNVESKLGKGSTFKIFFPVSKNQSNKEIIKISKTNEI